MTNYSLLMCCAAIDNGQSVKVNIITCRAVRYGDRFIGIGKTVVTGDGDAIELDNRI